MKSKTKRYFYCQTDNHGQNTGHVKEIHLSKHQVKEKNGLIYFNNIFLYENYSEAIRSALN